MIEVPSFKDFYCALTGRNPYLWQQDLAQQVLCDAGAWPDTVEVPTGLGKSSAISIALWLLIQRCAGRTDISAPTRIWYVTNRRLLVNRAFDDATVYAQKIHGADDPDSVLGVARRVLRQRVLDDKIPFADNRSARLNGEDRRELFVTGMIGGGLRQRPIHPAEPAVICATVPLFASRFLFRGYGLSRRVRPIDAAMAGTDALVLLDESHLSDALRNLLRNAPLCDLSRSQSTLQMVSLTATPVRMNDTSRTFSLTSVHRAESRVKDILAVRKPVTLKSVKSEPKEHHLLCEKLKNEAVGFVVDGMKLDLMPRVVVFCNTVRVASQVYDEVTAELDRRHLDATVVLVTGRMRPADSRAKRALLESLDDGAPNSDERHPLKMPLIVVSTQTLEVGADLNFDFLVTECAGASALIQRFGRLRRSPAGVATLPERAATIVYQPGFVQQSIYGEAVEKVYARLSERMATLDLSAEGIEETLSGSDLDPTPAAGMEFLPPHLWEYVKTNFDEVGAMPVEYFYDGDPDLPQVSICWRAFTPDSDEFQNYRLTPTPSPDECVTLEIQKARTGLATIIERRHGIQGGIYRTTKDDGWELVNIGDLCPGDTVILNSSDGGYSERLGWDPECVLPVSDLSLRLHKGGGLDRVAPVYWIGTKGVLEQLVDADDAGPFVDRVNSLALSRNSVAGRQLVKEILDCAGSSQQLLRMLRTESGDWDVDMLIVSVESVLRASKRGRPSVRALVIQDRRDAAAPVNASRAQVVDLYGHQELTGEVAKRLAAMLGMPPFVQEVLRLAGRLHDIGKASPSFQTYLGADDAGLLAKSVVMDGAGEAIGNCWPDAGRHEILSARIVEGLCRAGLIDCDDSDLLVHLVASHHGYARPMSAHSNNPKEETGFDFQYPILGQTPVTITASSDLQTVDWDRPSQFRGLNEKYGAWQLALFESIVRQADWIASAAIEELQ